MKLLSIIYVTFFLSNTFANPSHDILYTDKTLIDTNEDGIIDYWRSFNSKGDIVEIRKDLNFDQKIDYVKNVISPYEQTSQIDTDFNGFFETTHEILFKHEKPRREISTKDFNEDGKIDLKEELNHQYRNKRTLIFTSKDSNYDGKFEEKKITHRPLVPYIISPFSP